MNAPAPAALPPAHPLTGRPFWSDDFDGDLYALVPGARELLRDGPASRIRLFTHCHPCGRTGGLNSPSCWNHDLGMVSFFGFRSPSKPAVFVTNEPVIACTLEEALRDAFSHRFVMLVEGHPILRDPAPGNAMDPAMHLLYDKRGWTVLSNLQRRRLQVKVERWLAEAVGACVALLPRYGMVIGR